MSLWRVERLGRRGDGVAVGGAGRALAALTLPGEEIEGEAAGERIAAPRVLRWASAMRARMPPSPLLSARMTRATYLIVTTSTSDQKISDSTPSVSARVTPAPVSKWAKLALSA